MVLYRHYLEYFINTSHCGELVQNSLMTMKYTVGQKQELLSSWFKNFLLREKVPATWSDCVSKWNPNAVTPSAAKKGTLVVFKDFVVVNSVLLHTGHTFHFLPFNIIIQQFDNHYANRIIIFQFTYPIFHLLSIIIINVCSLVCQT
jgi:hypothetical protein